MDELNEIKSLGDGRYSFWVGRQKYTLATKLEPARFCRIAEGVSSLVIKEQAEKTEKKSK